MTATSTPTPVPKPAPTRPPAIDPKLVLPFVGAVRTLFKTMVKADVTVGRPLIKSAASPTHDVSGIIGFSGEMTGSVAVSFSQEAAVRLVESFCGVRLGVTSPDFADAIGELANMIAGSAKRELDARANISTPSVVIGRGFVLAAVTGVPCLVIPCSTEFGDFAVEIAIERRSA